MWWLGFIVGAQSAVAGPFTGKTMRQDWPEKRIDREWTLPKGWFQFGVSAQHKQSHKYRDGDGELADHPEGVRWDTSRLTFQIEHGFSNRTRVYLHLPIVHAHLKTADDGHIRTYGLGDANAGVWVQPWLGNPWAVAFKFNLKAPSGVEWPGSGNFLTGTGLTNFSAGVHARMKWIPVWSTKLSLSYTIKFPAIVGYVQEEEGFGQGRLDAGDAIDIHLDQTLQVSNALSIDITTDFSYRTPYYMGAAGPGLGWYDPQLLLGPSYYLNVGGSVVYEPFHWLDFQLGADMQVLGTDTRTFSVLGLEEFSPQPGLTVHFGSRIRW